MKDQPAPCKNQENNIRKIYTINIYYKRAIAFVWIAIVGLSTLHLRPKGRKGRKGRGGED